MLPNRGQKLGEETAVLIQKNIKHYPLSNLDQDETIEMTGIQITTENMT